MDKVENPTRRDGSFEWPEQHRDYWLKLAASVGGTEQQARCAYGLSTGMSQAAAARFAHYKGDGRTAGYHAARTKKITTMLTLAEGDGWESPDDMVSEEDKAKLLNSLMRSGDPQVRLKAIQLSDTRREKELEREAAERPDRFDYRKTLDEIGALDPLLAKWLAHSHGITWSIPAPSIGAAVSKLEQIKEWVLADAMRARGDDRGGSGLEANGIAGA